MTNPWGQPGLYKFPHVGYSRNRLNRSFRDVGLQVRPSCRPFSNHRTQRTPEGLEAIRLGCVGLSLQPVWKARTRRKYRDSSWAQVSPCLKFIRGLVVGARLLSIIIKEFPRHLVTFSVSQASQGLQASGEGGNS